MQWNMQALLSLSDAMLQRTEACTVLTCHCDPSDAPALAWFGLVTARRLGPLSVPLPQAEQ